MIRRRHPAGAAVRLLAMVLAIGVLAAMARGQEQALEYLQPRLDRTTFEQFCQRLGVTRDQRILKEFLYSDYAAAVSELAARLDADAEAAGRGTVTAALSGQVRVAPADLQAMRLAVYDAYRSGFAEAEALFDQLLIDTEALLEPAAGAFAIAVRELRRVVWLEPRRAGEMHDDYAGSGVDVTRLAEEAAREGGELHGLPNTDITAVLDAYEFQLDVLLVDSATSFRDAEMDLITARIRRDAQAMREAERALLDHWRQLYDLNRRTVQQIGDLAAAAGGEDVRARWLERFDRASFPWLHHETTPERQFTWMRTAGLEAEQLRRAEELYAEFAVKLAELRRRAVEIMVRGRIEHGRMIQPMMDLTSIADSDTRRLYQELVRNSGERSNLIAAAGSSLEAVLDERRQTEMRRALRR